MARYKLFASRAEPLKVTSLDHLITSYYVNRRKSGQKVTDGWSPRVSLPRSIDHLTDCKAQMINADHRYRVCRAEERRNQRIIKL